MPEFLAETDAHRGAPGTAALRAGDLAEELVGDNSGGRLRAFRGGGLDAAAAFAAAISSLHEHSTPYHLAHCLLDHAEYLTRLGDAEAAEVDIGEARDIAGRLRCQPLLDRATDLTPAQPRVGA